MVKLIKELISVKFKLVTLALLDYSVVDLLLRHCVGKLCSVFPLLF